MPSYENKFSNKNVAQLLRNFATSYTLIGDPMEKDGKVSSFRIIAYEKAADTIDNLPQEIYVIWKSGNLYNVPGIGQGIGSALEELFSTGESSHFNQVLKYVPASVFVLMNVSGIGPKKAFRLVQEFETLDEKNSYFRY